MDSDPPSKRESFKTKAGWPVAVVMPEFGGLRVVEVKRGDRLSPGDLIGWSDVSAFDRQGGGGYLCLTLNGEKSVTVSVCGGGRAVRLAARLKKRFTRDNATEPVFTYAPKRESAKAYWWSAGLAMVIFSGAGVFLLGGLILRSPPLPWSGSDTLKFVVLAAISCLPILIVVMFWPMRPREPQFDHVTVTDEGFRMEQDGSGADRLAVEAHWSDVRASKPVRSDQQQRFRLDLLDGRRVWLVIPRQVRHDVLGRMPVALGGIRPDPARERETERRCAVRLSLLGPVSGLLWIAVVHSIGRLGMVLPADLRMLAFGGAAGAVLLGWYIAALYWWQFWQSTPRGRRTKRRWSRRLLAACTFTRARGQA